MLNTTVKHEKLKCQKTVYVLYILYRRGLSFLFCVFFFGNIIVANLWLSQLSIIYVAVTLTTLISFDLSDSRSYRK